MWMYVDFVYFLIIKFNLLNMQVNSLDHSQAVLVLSNFSSGFLHLFLLQRPDVGVVEEKWIAQICYKVCYNRCIYKFNWIFLIYKCKCSI